MTHEFVDSKAEMEELLREETVGFLGMSADGRPYVVPINYSYHADGRLLMHCALEGRKLDAIRANPDVCFTVGRQAGTVRRHHGDVCHLDSDSVICFGRAHVVTENPERATLLNEFNRAFRPGAPDIPEKQVRHCAVIEITLAEMTGRRERGRTRTLWRHVFRA